MLSTSFPTSIRSIFGLIYSAIFTLISFVGAFRSPYDTDMPAKDADFTSAIRFVVFTDPHGNSNNVKDMINTCYELYGDDGIDLFVCCGDFAEIGTDGQMTAFADAFYPTINGRSETLVIAGNHDLKTTYDAADRYKELTGEEAGNQHLVINGFHFIGLQSRTESFIQLYGADDIFWLSKELRAAEKDSDSLPVFTFQHPHIRGTVYGSTIWGTDALGPVFENHNRVVNFSGHSHFPIEDPRSVWQGTYTCFGCGGLEKFELEKDLIWNQHPDGYDDIAEFYIVEADTNGAVKVDAYDLMTDTVFVSYFIEDVNDPSTYAYTYKNRVKYDDVPEFATSTKINCETNENGEMFITFDRATDKLAVHDYKVTVKNRFGLIILSKTYLSDYYLQDVPEKFTINLGELNLDPGDKFTVTIQAANAYYELSSPVTASFVY